MTSLLLLVAALLAACGSAAGSPSASPTAPPTDEPRGTPVPPGPLVSVELRGGHCMEGAVCGTTVILDTDGTVHDAAEPPNELGTVPESDVTGMADLIAETDFEAIKAKPFTGTCPVAFDGQEAVYEFTTPSGVERIESCTTEVDLQHPLFEAVAGVLVDYVQIPEF